MASLFKMVMFALNPRGVSREMASLVPNKSIAKDACGIAFTTYHHFDGHCEKVLIFKKRLRPSAPLKTSFCRVLVLQVVELWLLTGIVP